MYSLIIEKIWSSNIFLPKATIIRYKAKTDYYYRSVVGSNSYGKYCYRLRVKIVNKDRFLPESRKDINK